jgi:uncharacterized protein YegL
MSKDTLVIDGDTYKKVKKGVVTNIHFILDNSGSMGIVLDPTISGFNEYVNTLKTDGNKYRMTLTKFGDNVETVYEAKDLTDVPELNRDTYQADGGMTALYDAVCSTLKGVKNNKAEKNLVIIMTDGAENSSREYTQKDLQNIKKELESGKNWTFVFLGANQDSYATAASFGINKGNVTNFNASAAGVRSASINLAHSTGFMAQSASMSLDGTEGKSYFSKEQQDEVEGAK